MMRKFMTIGISFILLCFFIVSCQPNTTTEGNITSITTVLTTTLSDTTTTTSLPTEELVWDYLGEIPPTDQVIRFDPNGFVANNSWFFHGTPVFSPDGKEVYISKYIRNVDQIEVWYSSIVDGSWNTLQKLVVEGLSGQLNCPVFVAEDDGLYLMNYYHSMFRIYHVTRTDHGWGNPVVLPIKIPSGKQIGWNYSIAANKNIYFTVEPYSDGNRIYRSVYSNGVYATPEPISVLNGGVYGAVSPKIAYDESFIFFESTRTDGYGYHDIYVSFKDGEGNFLEPINLGNQINSPEEEFAANLSVDGKYFFFTTSRSGDIGYNPYWIKLDEIECFQNR